MLVVVGGHARNLGKTSVVCGLIRRLRQANWTALKITQYSEGPCAHSSRACECAPESGEPFALTEEYEKGKSDTGRYLAAGAERSFWLRAPAGRLFEAAGMVARLVDQSPNMIIESNSIVEFVDPHLFLMLLDFGCEDFKPSSLRFMDRADAFLVIDRGLNVPLWEGVAAGVWDHQPRLTIRPPAYVNTDVAEFVASRMLLATGPQG